MQVISNWLHQAATQLITEGVPSARLDAEIILAHTLRKSRTYLHAHSDDILSDRHVEVAEARLRLRLDRTPIAYIIGHKEFYGRMFRVTPATLIPRPESETIITITREIAQSQQSLFSSTPTKVVDVGTGSGCLGISIKLELPETDVSLLDISNHALNVATTNAKQLNADVTIIQSDLLTNYPFNAAVIIANLPYVDPTWERSPETVYEPAIALFADKGGLFLIDKLIPQAHAHLISSGRLLLEADPVQHASIVKLAKNHGFLLVEIRDYIVHLRKA